MKRISILLLVFCICSAVAAWPQAQAQWNHKHKIIEFEAPGARDTEPWSIDSKMNIVGGYADSNGVVHGFLRDPNGHFTEIDDPHAGTGHNQGTQAETIVNYSGGNWITGIYADSNNVAHGFQLKPNGKFKEIDYPHAGKGFNQGTYSYIMNPTGEIAGDFVDSNGVWHDFLLDPKGNFTKWDCLQAGTGSGQGTINWPWPWMLNSKGEVQAMCLDSNNVYHGSIRHPNGKVIDFDAKGAGKNSGNGTFPMGINSKGWVSGYYLDSNGVGHGFVRNAGGKITRFDVKGATATDGETINSKGVIAGAYADAKGSWQHGFVRAPDGTITTYYVPGAGKQPAYGLYVTVINDEGAIAGSYLDSNGVYHGFLRLP